MFGCQAPDSGNSEIIALAGTDEQKERWLFPLLNGEIRSAFSMTEPDTPGSDPTQLRTRAVRDGDGYVLDGHKWFTSNGSIADFLVVMAVTDPDAAPHERASMFLVPVDTPGVNLVRDVANMEQPYEHYGMLGGHTEIRYENVRLGHDALLGKEGEGFLIAQHRLVPGRIHHCMRWLGVARRAFDMMCERSLYRPVKGGLLKDKQTVQGWIADSAAEMQAARLMTLHAAWKIDMFGSSAARTDVSMIKFFGAKVLHDVVDRALQLHGGLGYSTDMPLEMLYRYARHARFVDGADEVHRESVARHILRAYEAPDDGIPTEHVPTAGARPRAEVRRRACGDERRGLRTMRAVQLVAWQAEPELRDVPVPEPGPGEVLLKITAAGLCHSDLHIMEWPEGTMPWPLPFTLGHESGRHRRGARGRG